MDQSKKTHLWPVYIVVFLDMLGFGMIIPVIRDYTQLLVEHSDIQTNHFATYAGILMASYSLFQFIFAPILGRLSDIYGRKKLLVVSVFGNVISYFMWAISNNYWFFLASRIVSGATGGNISVAQSYIADHTTQQERAKYMGIMGALFGIGFILGPFFGGILSVFDMSKYSSGMIIFNQYSSIGVATMALSGLNIIWIISKLRDSNPAADLKESSAGLKSIDIRDIQQTNKGAGSVNAEKSIKNKKVYAFAHVKSIKNNQLKLVFLSFFILSMGFVHVEATLAWDLKDRFSLDAKNTGYFFAYMGIVMAIVQGLIYRKLLINNSLIKLARWGTLILSAGLVIMPLGSLIIITALITIIMAFGMGIGNPSMLTLASIKSSETEQGISLGIMQSFGSLARIIAPITATLAYDNIGTASPYFISAAFVFFSFLILSKLNREETKTEQPD